ncbi:MAG: hypothetical protein H7Z74_09180 [Anaerolineae bacterium]|nr:hypothetical protein [Gemmatimonadaceae bacterium]
MAALKTDANHPTRVYPTEEIMRNAHFFLPAVRFFLAATVVVACDDTVAW